MSPGMERLLDIPEFQHVLSSYDGNFTDPLWRPQERPVIMRVASGPLGIPLHRCRGLRPFVESVPEPEDSSPVLTWILGYFWSLPREVSPRLDRGMHVPFPPEL